MEQFNTLEKVKGLFAQVTYGGNNASCYFMGVVDYSNLTVQMVVLVICAAIGGFLAGILGGMAFGSAGVLVIYLIYNSKKERRFLVMETPEGIGMIPLRRAGGGLRPCPEAYFFINRGDIKNIKIASRARNAQRVTLELNNQKTLQFILSKKDKQLPYQEENVEMFCRNNR